MNGMSPQLKVVFDLVSKLCRETHRNIFSFKLSEILSRLDDSGDTTKYGIDTKGLQGLLNELAESGFVKLDYVEEVELGDNRVDYRWKYGKDDWIYEEVQAGQDIRNFFGKVYFNISQSEIKEVNDVFEKRYIATLSYEDPHFIVNCDNRKYIIPGLEYGAPYTILNYIMQNNLVDKLVTKKMLISKLKINHLQVMCLRITPR